MFWEDAVLLPSITTEIKMLLDTLVSKFVKGREIEAADTHFKIAKVNAIETANHVAAF